MKKDKLEEMRLYHTGNCDCDICYYIKQDKKQALEDVKKIIDEFSKIRLYRSKSCQLLLRRIKQKLKSEMKK